MFGIILCLFGGLALFLLLGTFSPKKKGKKKKKEKSDRIDSLTWDDETEDLFEDDEFHFTPVFLLNKKAKAQIIWADPLPVPAEPISAFRSDRSAREKKRIFAPVAALFAGGFVCFRALLALLSALFFSPAEGSPGMAVAKTVFSVLLAALFALRFCLPALKKTRENAWAKSAIHLVTAVLFSVLLILFFAVCRSF